MSQDWVANLYTTATVGDTTLSNMELMFATLKSSFSGASQPSSPVPGQNWFDTSKKLLKVRNQGDTAWLGILAGLATFKIWAYLNGVSGHDGWAQDATVTDVVLALKGGSTYVTGGIATQGNFTLSGISLPDHPSHIHTLVDKASISTVHLADKTVYKDTTSQGLKANTSAGAGSAYQAGYDTGGPSVSLTHGLTHDGSDRPKAAVGIMVYPDV